ncbi:sigma factor [Streptomyces sp. NPDC086776]|jgi:hypothetical protein|uniref:sigma factor n=2 Tax=Streptomyces TaxID=1883 RepID=UPI000890003B|nr:Sigma-70 region 2 [Streptomyces sp. 136MFCol5.1]
MTMTGMPGGPGVLEVEWELHRPAVFGVAYRLLGSVADAEDVAQDAWLRAAGADLRRIDDLRAWLVTVAARRSYDVLKSARARRETYVGLVRLLHPEAVCVTDGGGEVSTARKLVHGGPRIAKLMVGVGLRWRPDRIDLVEVGGEPCAPAPPGRPRLLRGHGGDQGRSGLGVPQGSQPGGDRAHLSRHRTERRRARRRTLDKAYPTGNTKRSYP